MSQSQNGWILFPPRALPGGTSEAVSLLLPVLASYCALEQGRAVYALPGRVDEPLSAGCNRLISQGAGPAYSPEYLLEELKILCGSIPSEKEKVNFGLATDLELVYSCLGFQPRGLQSIQEETGVPVLKLKEMLLELELDGWIQELMKDHYVKLR